MCLVLLALGARPESPVILAANRDERHGRPADGLHWWPDRPYLAGGRDRCAGGAWLAVHAGGRFGAVLNDGRYPAPADAPSRGELVPRFLAAVDPVDAIGRIGERASAYAGFHFVGGTASQAWYCARGAAGVVRLGPGVHGIDNTGLEGAGARLRHARAGLLAALAEPIRPERMLEVLADTGEPDPPPETNPETEAGDNRPVFVRDGIFGTRCSTVLRVNADGRAQLVERRFDAGGEPTGEDRLEWAWSPAG